ncbi:Acyl-CoA synthetase family member 4 [Pteropus alecto]|uniref:Beta-alanine-activating enzyme n=1 Tax=Pteropus alecto TaxID=9402 RepID=L5JWH6_PTEAL|nr:Acyl-CoA synthetase family member 4 [Pteropus alecto]
MTLQELVHQAASIYSDKIAVCFDECNDQSPIYYTYKTLLNTASELSDFLLLHCDFQEIREIGLYCHPGINLPSWILGILQVPAAYAPVDPDASPALSTHFMKKCDLKYILVEKRQINKFRSSYETLLNYDTFTVEHNDLVLFRLYWKNVEVSLMLNDRKEKYEKVTDGTSSENSKEEKSEEHMDVRLKHCLAYVLHTSGTTGIPKIVRVPHACIVPNIQHFRVLFEITQEDVVFLASPLTFDPSVVEIFVALSSGASLLIVPTSVKVLPSKLAAVLFSHHRVTILQATPTLLRRFGSQLIKSTVLSASTSLRVLALGGETFPSLTILKSWRELGNRTQIFNVYGITEVSSWATFYRIPEKVLNSTLKCELPVQLGFPLHGTVVEVRDTDGFTIEEGNGQVFLGGRNRVCFLDGEMTVPLGTMRATGDFVTVKNGEMFFLGRKDSQIKRHGKRLNIDLVQQVAEGLRQVESCAVTWYNQEKLILFLVSKKELVKDYIFKELEKHLPNYAIPDELVLIDSLPFTSHGCYNGLIYVLKSHNGEKYWMFTTENAVKSSATVDPTTGLLYIGSHDQHAYALDIYKKKCVWKLKCGGTIFSSPCLSLIPHHLYFATLGGLLLAVHPATGNRVWKHSCGKPLFSSPRCCLQFVCIGCVDGNLLCFTHFGEQVWQFSTNEPIFSSPCTSTSEQEIFFGSHDCFIYCCSMKGHLQWKFKTTSRVYSTPFAFHNHNRSNEMLLAAASTDGKLWILESKSGQLQTVYELPGEVFSSPVVWESMLIIGCRNNYVYCLDLLGGNKK